METQADGKKRAAIKEAEGLAQGKVIVAEGQAQAIKLVNEAANQYFIGNAQLLKKLDTVSSAFAKNAKIVLPEGKSLVNVIGSLTGEQDK